MANVLFFGELLDKADDLKPVKSIAFTSFQWHPQAVLTILTKFLKGSLQISVMRSSCISEERTGSLVFTN